MKSEYAYKLTPLAENDIDSALEYIAQTLCNTKAALDLMDKIERAIQNACVFPYSAADCHMFLINDDKTRHIPVDNYVLIYEVDERAKLIKILRFLYAAMDLTKQVI